MSGNDPVHIIGGGWAGLAAALELITNDIPVVLYESAPQLGGRARNAPFGDLTVDNGQHLLIGAYSETLRLLSLMGAKEGDLFLRHTLRLKVVEGSESMVLQAPPLLPAPLHLVWALLTAEGLELSERLQALKMSLQLKLNGFTTKEDKSVSALLQQHRQGERIIRRFWEPLCLATLNTPLSHASAQVFLRVLKDSFSRSRHDADLLLPKEPLGDLFPRRAADYLRQRGGLLQTQHRIETLQIDHGRLAGLTLAKRHIPCNEAIIATAPTAAARLLAPHGALETLEEQLRDLGSQPITTLYLQYPPAHRLEEPMMGLSGTVGQWLFDRRICGQPGLIAVVISAAGPHLEWSNERLTTHITDELHRQFPHWPEVVQSRVIREMRATFECSVGVASRRPGHATPIDGLWLAGDYTDTGYPATLEGAVRSGVECAKRIVAKRQ